MVKKKTLRFLKRRCRCTAVLTNGTAMQRQRNVNAVLGYPINKYSSREFQRLRIRFSSVHKHVFRHFKNATSTDVSSSSLICFSTRTLIASVTFERRPLPSFRPMEPVKTNLFKNWCIPCFEATIPSLNNRFAISGAFKPLRWKNIIRSFL